MPPEELTLILKLRDEATKQLKSVKGTVTAIGGAMVATGLKVGAEWAKSTKTIVDGTGATGPALKRLQADFQAVAKHGAARAATAIADLNTHLGLTGPDLQRVADLALKASIDTSKFGAVAEQTGRDVDGYAELLNDLTAAGMATGVSTNQLLDTIGKNSARWKAGGGDIEGLIAHVTELANEFGPTGLRGAMSETMAEVDTGVIPTVTSLRDQFGDTSTVIEDARDAAYTWRDAIRETKDAAIAYLGPAGDMLAGVGSMAVGLVHLIPLISKTAVVQRVLNLAMKLNPIGLVIAAITLAGVAIWTFRDQIMGFLRGAWNAFVGAIEGAINFLRPLADFIGIELPDDLGSWKIAQEEATEAVEAAEPAVSDLDTATAAMAVTMAAEAVPAVAAARVEIEAFDLSTVNLKNQLQQAQPEIRNIGDMLEAAGIQTETGALAFGFYADEADILSGKMGVHKNEIPPMILEMMTPPPGIRDALGVLDDMAAEAALKAGTTFAGGFFAILQRSFEGGGNFMGALKSSISEGLGALFAEGGALEGVSQKWGTALEAIGGIPIVGPFLKAFAPALIGGVVAIGKKAWGALKRMFGEGLNAAEEAYQGIVDAATNAAAADAALNQHMTEALAAGLDERAAAVRAFLIHVRTEQGATWAEADAEFQRFHAAQADSASASEKAWAESTAQRLVVEYAALGTQAEIAGQVVAVQAAAAQQTVEIQTAAAQRTVEVWSGSAVEIVSIEVAKTETVKVLATEVATHAIVATEQVVEIQAVAAEQTVEAWGGAAVEIVANETVKTETMKVLNTEVANHTIAESARAAAAAIAASNQVAAAAARAASAARSAASAASSYGGGGGGGGYAPSGDFTGSWDRSKQGDTVHYESSFLEKGWTRAGETKHGLAIYESPGGGTDRYLDQGLLDVTGDLEQIGRDKRAAELARERHEVIVESKGRFYSKETGKLIEGRARGGAVRPDQGYMVGERGPEYFSPNTPGYITPNDGGKASARMIGLEVAKALQESPISIPQDAVTDSVLRAAPGREALRGWA